MPRVRVVLSPCPPYVQPFRTFEPWKYGTNWIWFSFVPGMKWDDIAIESHWHEEMCVGASEREEAGKTVSLIEVSMLNKHGHMIPHHYWNGYHTRPRDNQKKRSKNNKNTIFFRVVFIQCRTDYDRFAIDRKTEIRRNITVMWVLSTQGFESVIFLLKVLYRLGSWSLSCLIVDSYHVRNCHHTNKLFFVLPMRFSLSYCWYFLPFVKRIVQLY